MTGPSSSQLTHGLALLKLRRPAPSDRIRLWHPIRATTPAVEAWRQRLTELDPEITMLRMTTFGEQVSEAFNQERLLARLTTLFGILALTLASIGLYGVTTYTVEQRTREIGIRVAVGATRANVVRMVLSGAFIQVALGLVMGIPLALLAGWLISSQLFEVKGHDPIAMVLAALALAVCALVAGLVPARRAASIEPMQALRTE